MKYKKYAIKEMDERNNRTSCTNQKLLLSIRIPTPYFSFFSSPPKSTISTSPPPGPPDPPDPPDPPSPISAVEVFVPSSKLAAAFLA